MATNDENPPAKRRKLDTSHAEETVNSTQQISPQGLERPISPPLSRRNKPAVAVLAPTWGFDNVPEQEAPSASLFPEKKQKTSKDVQSNKSRPYMPSPIQLTQIDDMGVHQNINTVSLKDILGDPMIKQCWNFNYLFDVDFVMKHFDEDVRDLVEVKIVHGFWKSEDPNRSKLFETAEQYPNIQLLPAYLPDAFGTHHSKMLVLFRHDDYAQVIIHTANMIQRDWSNMTQAVWSSPLLPLLSSTTLEPGVAVGQLEAPVHPVGSGERFKIDMIQYLRAYGNRLVNLTTQLADYDFSAIKAAFIGSAPSRRKPANALSSKQTSFGWLGLQEILSSIPVNATLGDTTSPPHIIIQISSIATLGAAPTWLTNFQSVLRRAACPPTAITNKSSAFFTNVTAEKTSRPKFNIIFPTPEEIRTSLDGWASGASIHMKLQSIQQQKQLEYLLPLFCHWKSPSPPAASKPQTRHGEALRGPAAPHIKTYIRFSDETHRNIDWAMVTSANLSKQAWGDVVNKKDEIWIQSYEAGVVVWPALFGGEDTVMVPVFGKDMPDAGDAVGDDGEKPMVGFRMPYDLPLSPYSSGDKPWCATMQYKEPDWKNLAWGGY
ncbi:tyrosyl-DNA phosphodiesterase 1 [Paraphoma chrysanthemicola]|uniref:Tyrosyl-DNA phosphodiesterase 1 n=1 Tax=Paraphoma chrysanthemicola TaxID=798071 RepID=A0A8K0QWM4_9PLEO|nr:tyrosyl-DNA phosphodiesterase 1 [Paraphoma chrysanthemicola]